MRTKSLQRKRAMRTALLVLLLGAAGMGKGYAFVEIDGIYYSLSSSGTTGTATVVNNGENSYSGSINIPYRFLYNSVAYNVKYISENAFKNCRNLTSVVISSNIESIGANAFYGCNNLTTLYWCARNCTGNMDQLTHLTTLQIESGVQRFPSFKNCPRLTKVIYYGTSSCISRFTDYEQLTTVVIGGTLPDNMFNGCTNLSSITFYSYNPFNPNAFYNTGWYNSQDDGILYLGNICMGCKNYSPSGHVEIGSNTIMINNEAFKNCYGITSISIPYSVTTIGNAFEGCSGITNVDFNARNCATTSFMQNLPNLSTVSFGNSVLSIPSELCSGCTGLTSITIPNNVISIGGSAFGNNSNLTSVNYNARNCDNGNYSVNAWGSSSLPPFINCENLTEINIGNGVMTIPDVFMGVSGLTSITIPNSVTSIGSSAFSFCTGLASIDIPQCVNEIGESSFNGCTALSSVSLYANCTSIGSMNAPAFSNCTRLTSLTIKDNVQTIPDYAFYGCNNLNTVISMSPTPPSIGTGALSNISPVAILFVPCESKMAYFSSWNCFEFNSIYEDCTPHTISISSNSLGGMITPSSAQAIMGEIITLTVTPNSGYEFLSIIVSNVNDPTQIIPVTPVGKTAYSYSFVMPPYAVSVSATFNYTSINENEPLLASVYPNPTDGRMTIKAEDLKHITISNMLGQVIYEGNASGNEFVYDFDQHGEGVYLVRIETSSGVVTKRVVVTQ